MNKKGKELGITELELAKIRQAEVDCKTAEANFRKAEAALHKFYATGPRKKKKSGRPSSWRSPHGLFFVQEVEDLAKKRNWTNAKALRIVSKQLSKAYGTTNSIIARAARLANQSRPPLARGAIQVRYSEARRYWKFLIDPESYQKKEQSLQRNLDKALSAWGEAATALRYLVRASLVRIGARNPYDFS
jgi:hypothetical protein